MKLWTLKDKKILIADDFPAMRSMMRNVLSGFGANCISEAKNGEEALEILFAQSQDIVLCDYNLGSGKDGQQVLEEVREKDKLPYSSIFVMVTAENTSEMVMGAVEFQPDDYLIKPFNKSVLQMRLRKLEEKKLAFQAISQAMENKNYQLAIRLCDQGIEKQDKNYLELTKLKAELLLRTSDLVTAQAVYDQVLSQRDQAWARFGLGKSYYLQNKLEEAGERFEQLIQSNKNFVVAYDYLARIEAKLGNDKKSQEILQKAVSISPKQILRQRALGELSLKNEDYEIAAKAYKTVVREGKNSIHRKPSDFGGLASVYVKTEEGKSAEKILQDMKKEFKGSDHKNALEASVIDGLLQKQMGNEEKSRESLAAAMDLFKQEPGNLSSDYAMQLAEVCAENGDTENASGLMQHVVRNNHEDDSVIEKAQQMYDAMGMADKGAELIAGTRAEMVSLNNDGVALAREGKLTESIQLFTKAARAMPENVVINLNTAQSILMLMKQQGVESGKLKLALEHLERVQHLDAANERFQKLMGSYRELEKSA